MFKNQPIRNRKTFEILKPEQAYEILKPQHTCMSSLKTNPKLKTCKTQTINRRKEYKNTLIECWLPYASGKYFMFVQYENT